MIMSGGNDMKIYTRVVLDMTSDNLDVIEAECYDYRGDVTLCGGGSSSGNKMSNEEKALYNQLTQNMQYFQGLYKNHQESYDLQVLEGNKKLYPQMYEYQEAQLADSRTDLAQNRDIKDAMADKNLKDITQQSQLSDAEFADSKTRMDRYNQVEGSLVNERLGMLSADTQGVMGKATSDVAQAYGQQRAALARDQSRLGIAPGSGAATESSRLSALDAAKANALTRETARNNELTRVEAANTTRTGLNWQKDSSLLNGGRASMMSATDYSAMLNGGYGVMNPYQVNMPGHTDFAAATNQAAGTAQGAPTGTYVQGGKSTGAGIAGGAVSGAAMGTAIMPGWGTAIGAVAGGVMGAMG
jgi:hypothetical protein